MSGLSSKLASDQVVQGSSQPKILQDQWSSKLTFILAATGAAVGLGNIWRFPYMAGEHGGSAFVILYIAFVVLIGLPIMVSEFVIGRRARLNSIDALATLAKQNNRSKHWGLLGWWGAIGLLLTLSFYSVVSGWSIAYIVRSFSGTFNHLGPSQITLEWHNFLSNPWQLLGWHTLFMCLTMGVIVAGVQKGLENATKLMMPALYIILFGLVIYACTEGDAKSAVKFLFAFDYHKITPTVVIAALGHAFFTLALGAGALLTYGAYIPPRVPLVSSVFIIAGLDVLVAFLAGLAIFPIVFALHLAPQGGPGLMFQTLPITFAHMPMGSLVGGLFFVLLLFAAWTASLNIAEPLIVITMNRLNVSRFTAAFIVGSFAWFLGIGSLLSFNVWHHVQLFGHYSVFDIVTNVTTDVILPIGGMGFAFFAGWVMLRKQTEEEMNTKRYIYILWRFLIRYVALIGVLCVFVGSVF